MDAQNGTSEAAPLFAGVLSLASQLNHGSVGPINKVLYDALSPHAANAGIVDVVTGDNSISSGGVPVPGFTATTGFDVASGWGTIDASRFVPNLVTATRAQNGNDSLQHQAADALTRLQHSIHLTNTHIAPGGSAYMLVDGFLPQHPVEVNIDNHKVETITANTLGSVVYIIDPSLLKLSHGRHTLSLKSMLLTATTNFETD
jgi:subtilase family serine protease